MSDFPSDEGAISDAGRFVSAEHPSVAVGRDAGEAIDFLGAWDWTDGQAAWARE